MNTALRLELLDRQPRRRTDLTLAHVLEAIEATRAEVRELRRQLDRRGGPPSGGGLLRDEIVAKVVELYAAGCDGDAWPTQEATAEALGKSVALIKLRQGPRGWAGIRADAQGLLNSQGAIAVD